MMRVLAAACLVSAIVFAGSEKDRPASTRGAGLSGRPTSSRREAIDNGGAEVITGHDLVAIPYFAWNNRGKGEMAVWIPYR